MTEPKLDISIGTDGITVDLALDADQLRTWTRERYLALLEVLGALPDVVLLQEPHDTTMFVIGSAPATTGPSPNELQAQPYEGPSNEVHLAPAMDGPPFPAAEPEPDPDPEPDPEPSLADLGTPDAARSLLAWVAENDDEVVDEDGWVIRLVTEGLGWTQALATDTIDLCETRGWLDVERPRPRRIRSLVLTSAGQDARRAA